MVYAAHRQESLLPAGHPCSAPGDHAAYVPLCAGCAGFAARGSVHMRAVPLAACQHRFQHIAQRAFVLRRRTALNACFGEDTRRAFAGHASENDHSPSHRTAHEALCQRARVQQRGVYQHNVRIIEGITVNQLGNRLKDADVTGNPARADFPNQRLEQSHAFRCQQNGVYHLQINSITSFVCKYYNTLWTKI